MPVRVGFIGTVLVAQLHLANLARMEDVEIAALCDISPEALARAVTAATGTPVTWIGVVRPATEGLALVEPDGRRRPLWAGGYDHFRTSGQGG